MTIKINPLHTLHNVNMIQYNNILVLFFVPKQKKGVKARHGLTPNIHCAFYQNMHLGDGSIHFHFHFIPHTAKQSNISTSQRTADTVWERLTLFLVPFSSFTWNKGTICFGYYIWFCFCILYSLHWKNGFIIKRYKQNLLVYGQTEKWLPTTKTMQRITRWIDLAREKKFLEPKIPRLLASTWLPT